MRTSLCLSSSLSLVSLCFISSSSLIISSFSCEISLVAISVSFYCLSLILLSPFTVFYSSKSRIRRWLLSLAAKVSYLVLIKLESIDECSSALAILGLKFNFIEFLLRIYFSLFLIFLPINFLNLTSLRMLPVNNVIKLYIYCQAILWK